MGQKLLTAARKAAESQAAEEEKPEDAGETGAETPDENEDAAADADARAEDEEEPDGDEGEEEPDAAEGAGASSASVAKAVRAERARVKAILSCAEAKGREASAQHLATDTDMTASAATALLATMPKGGAKGTLSEAMAGNSATKVGPGGPQAASGQGDDPSQRILASYTQATGKAVRPR